MVVSPVMPAAAAAKNSHARVCIRACARRMRRKACARTTTHWWMPGPGKTLPQLQDYMLLLNLPNRRRVVCVCSEGRSKQPRVLFNDKTPAAGTASDDKICGVLCASFPRNSYVKDTKCPWLKRCTKPNEPRVSPCCLGVRAVSLVSFFARSRLFFFFASFAKITLPFFTNTN